MRVLLDECLPRRLARELSGHEVATVPQAGWAGLRNGQLLSVIGNDWDVFVTIDGGLEWQQSLRGRPFAVVVLSSVSNRIEDLRPLLPELARVLEQARPGTVWRVPAASASA